MKNFFLNILILSISFSFVNFASSDEIDPIETEVNVYTGMFDFSDTKQASGFVGLQHQNDELFRESFLGKISPITGGFLTEKNAFYFYTGAQTEYNFGPLIITPSFAPGYYNSGDGK